jgi:hypothetical protein
MSINIINQVPIKSPLNIPSDGIQDNDDFVNNFNQLSLKKEQGSTSGGSKKDLAYNYYFGAGQTPMHQAVDQFDEEELYQPGTKVQFNPEYPIIPINPINNNQMNMGQQTFMKNENFDMGKKGFKYGDFQGEFQNVPVQNFPMNQNFGMGEYNYGNMNNQIVPGNNMNVNFQHGGKNMGQSGKRHYTSQQGFNKNRNKAPFPDQESMKYF